MWDYNRKDPQSLELKEFLALQMPWRDCGTPLPVLEPRDPRTLYNSIAVQARSCWIEVRLGKRAESDSALAEVSQVGHYQP